MDRMTGAAGRALVGLALVPLAAALASCGAPQTSTNLVAVGLKAQLSGDLATAESSYQQAIKLDSNNAVAHYDLGTIDDRHGNRSQAVAEYTAALVINPTFADALFNLGVDTTTANPSGAEELYLKVVSLQPSFAAAWLNLGFILQSQGNKVQASADWAKAVSIDSTLASRIPKPTPAGPPKP
jgi:tetratricopeptide (TPR) repeat protein